MKHFPRLHPRSPFSESWPGAHWLIASLKFPAWLYTFPLQRSSLSPEPVLLDLSLKEVTYLWESSSAASVLSLLLKQWPWFGSLLLNRTKKTTGTVRGRWGTVLIGVLTHASVLRWRLPQPITGCVSFSNSCGNEARPTFLYFKVKKSL